MYHAADCGLPLYVSRLAFYSGMWQLEGLWWTIKEKYSNRYSRPRLLFSVMKRITLLLNNSYCKMVCHRLHEWDGQCMFALCGLLCFSEPRSEIRMNNQAIPNNVITVPIDDDLVTMKCKQSGKPEASVVWKINGKVTGTGSEHLDINLTDYTDSASIELECVSTNVLTSSSHKISLLMGGTCLERLDVA